MTALVSSDGQRQDVCRYYNTRNAEVGGPADLYLPGGRVDREPSRTQAQHRNCAAGRV